VLVRPVPDSAVTVAQAILSYSNIRAVPANTEGLLDTLGAEIGTTPLADINYDWTEQWISALKREKHLAPGTIHDRPAGPAARHARHRCLHVVHVYAAICVSARSSTCPTGPCRSTFRAWCSLDERPIVHH
jgi:hypothetical protein